MIFSGFKERRARAKEEKFAKENGYFWLPCPVCDKPFGGHEIPFDPLDVPMFVPDWQVPGQYVMICPDCVEAGAGQIIGG